MTAGVSGVAFYSVEGVVFDFFDDPDMVGDAVLLDIYKLVLKSVVQKVGIQNYDKRSICCRMICGEMKTNIEKLQRYVILFTSTPYVSICILVHIKDHAEVEFLSPSKNIFHFM